MCTRRIKESFSVTNLSNLGSATLEFGCNIVKWLGRKIRWLAEACHLARKTQEVGSNVLSKDPCHLLEKKSTLNQVSNNSSKEESEKTQEVGLNELSKDPSSTQVSEENPKKAEVDLFQATKDNIITMQENLLQLAHDLKGSIPTDPKKTVPIWILLNGTGQLLIPFELTAQEVMDTLHKTYPSSDYNIKFVAEGSENLDPQQIISSYKLNLKIFISERAPLPLKGAHKA